MRRLRMLGAGCVCWAYSRAQQHQSRVMSSSSSSSSRWRSRRGSNTQAAGAVAAHQQLGGSGRELCCGVWWSRTAARVEVQGVGHEAHASLRSACDSDAVASWLAPYVAAHGWAEWLLLCGCQSSNNKMTVWCGCCRQAGSMLPVGQCVQVLSLLRGPAVTSAEA